MKWRVPRWRLDSGLIGRRGSALLLALAIEAIVVLLLLYLVPPLAGREEAHSPSIFSVDAADAANEEEVAKRDEAKPSERATRPPSPLPPANTPPPVPPTPRGELPFIVMTRDELRAAQIANMVSRPSEPAEAAAAPSASRFPDSPLAAGKGPNDEPLYAAEWYRRPRQVELDPYLPRRWAREGSGLIACRTVARYRVEDCRILGESPTGSGYGYAVLQAAFQFLVRPPRVGGREKVGEWVSIRIDYTVIVK